MAHQHCHFERSEKSVRIGLVLYTESSLRSHIFLCQAYSPHLLLSDYYPGLAAWAEIYLPFGPQKVSIIYVIFFFLPNENWVISGDHTCSGPSELSSRHGVRNLLEQGWFFIQILHFVLNDRVFRHQQQNYVFNLIYLFNHKNNRSHLRSSKQCCY